MRLHEVHQVLAVDGLDVVHGAQDGAAQRAVLERGRVQLVKHHLARLLVDLGCQCVCVLCKGLKVQMYSIQ